MEKLYLECYSGISGDMTVAALLDLGADENVLRNVLNSIPIDGFEIKISRVEKSGLDACDFDVILDKRYENHDHDMNYLYEHHHHEEGHHHHHEEEHHHNHEGHEHHEEHHHVHEHRGLPEVLDIIEHTKMSDSARQLARSIFQILAEAEAKVHGKTIETVHFHEVGAIDSIVDIIAVAVCLDNLKVKETVIPYLCEGIGTIRCQHGILPIPVPAVAAIARQRNLTLSITDCKGELVTPTGAAIAAAIRTQEELPEKFSIRKIGLGAGKREYSRTGVLRAMLIEETGCECQDEICRLESNIDDCSGETFGYAMERLFLEGAKDVYYFPIFMKKNRPAYQLNVICEAKDSKKLEEIIFEETTTIGIRKCMMKRNVLDREVKQIETPLGIASVKVCKLPSGERAYPEYESVRKLARENGKSYWEAFQVVSNSIEI